MARWHAIAERLRLSLWFIPALLAVLAVLLALGLLAVDRQLGPHASALFLFTGSPDGARRVLSTIAQSMLTFTGLVFTITMLVLQLASSQLSPRVMRTFLRDRGNQTVLGLFVATFVFTLLVLREVRTPVNGGDPFVPAVSVWTAFGLLLASVAAFIWYIDHMAHSIRARTVIENIWRETAAALDRWYPDRAEAAGDGGPPRTRPTEAPDLVIKARTAGSVTSIDEDRLVAAVRAGSRTVSIVPMLGDFVPIGAPVAQAWGSWDRADADEARQSVGIGGERSVEQDPAFGFRQLVDVAVRALSPGTNDPTTAVQALDRLHDLLRRLAVRGFPPSVLEAGDHGRVVLNHLDWEGYLGLAVDEIRLSGAGQLQVMARLRVLLDDLAAIAPASRRAAIAVQRAELEAAIDRGFASSGDRRVANGERRSGDRQRRVGSAGAHATHSRPSPPSSD